MLVELHVRVFDDDEFFVTVAQRLVSPLVPVREIPVAKVMVGMPSIPTQRGVPFP